MMFEQMVNNYQNAEKLFGQTMIRELTGYDPKYLDKNVKIPEFQRELKKRIKDKVDELKDKKLLKESGIITTTGLDAAALFLINEEFEQTKSGFSNFGEHIHAIADLSGDRTQIKPYKKGDKYKDLAVKQTITRAIKRGRKQILPVDLQTFEREAQQNINIIYAIDASGSMRGEKLRLAKKAGVSLAHKALKDRNKIGLVVFGSDIEDKVYLTSDFLSFVRPLTKITPHQETNIALAIEKSSELLDKAKGIKHIVILTDGLHTTSDNPEKEVLEKVLTSANQNITISVVGINLDEKGLKMAQQIVDNSKGNLYAVKDLEDMRSVIIADYNALQ
ncbi:MAG: VWA domain-containing protein [Candidatus Woesearchaeota archaeon]